MSEEIRNGIVVGALIIVLSVVFAPSDRWEWLVIGLATGLLLAPFNRLVMRPLRSWRDNL